MSYDWCDVGVATVKKNWQNTHRNKLRCTVTNYRGTPSQIKTLFYWRIRPIKCYHARSMLDITLGTDLKEWATTPI